MRKETNIEANTAVGEPIISKLDSLVATGKSLIWDVFVTAERLSLEARWKLGNLLAQHDVIIKSKVEMRYLGNKWGIWESELYRMRALRRIYPTLERLQEEEKKLEAMGHLPTWQYFRAKVLPQEHHTPSQFGGDEAAFSQTLDRIEHHAHEAAKLSSEVLAKYDQLDKPLQKEIEGSLTAVATTLIETRQLASHLEHLAKHLPDRSELHLSAVRKLPCCVCSVQGQSQAHHIYKTGLSLKGSDYMTIPLCMFHHQAYTDKGDAYWEEKYGSQLDKVIQTLSVLYGIPIDVLNALIQYAQNKSQQIDRSGNKLKP